MVVYLNTLYQKIVISDAYLCYETTNLRILFFTTVYNYFIYLNST